MTRLSIFSLAVFVILASIVGFVDAECKDRVGTTSCSRAASYCKSGRLAVTLKANCELTCGHCTPNVSNGNKARPAARKPATKKKPASAPKNNVPKYILHYFNFRFRGEPARMILHYAGVKFTDNQIDPTVFQSIKSSFPNGQVPLLQVDDKNLTQSNAIYRFLAHRYNLIGKSEQETTYLDQISEIFREMVDATTPYVQAKIGFLTGVDADDLYTNKFVPAIEKYAPQMEAFLEAGKTGFFGATVSWVDMYVTDSILTMNNFAPTVVAKYTTLLAHQKRVYGLPQLKNYIANRRVTPI